MVRSLGRPAQHCGTRGRRVATSRQAAGGERGGPARVPPVAGWRARMEFVEAHGARIPIVGFGSMRLKEDAGAKAIESAIRQGYRHVDTAVFYGNEREVG